MSDPLDLEARSGLPDALRALLQDYPREGWEADLSFDGLVRFWLDRHLMFRRLTALLVEDTQGLLDRVLEAPAYGRRLARLGSTLVGDLHGHHAIEDMHYFPRLARAEPRLIQGFDLLDRDHQALDARLAGFVEAANAVLRAVEEDRPTTDAGGALLGEIRRLEKLLDRHLVDEEELVVPVLLKHGAGDLG